MNKGFTIIELIVVIVIIAILSAVILFTINLYINKGKDSNIAGNLAILIPAGEVYYNGNGNSYASFCNSSSNSVMKNAIAQMPQNPLGSCYNNPNNLSGLCCYVDSVTNNKWAACAKKFTDNTKAFCVDSRGVKGDIAASSCNNTSLSQCP
jgi:prepilin-type N-terminal cleavage/methylation domain-containing protein